MHKTKTKQWLLVLGMIAMSAPVFAKDYVVVVHPDNNATLSKADIANLFLGQLRKFSNGTSAVPVMQVSGNPVSKAFMKSIIGKSWTQFRSYWSKRMFSGKGYPPERVKTDANVKAFIAKNKNGIGYISADAVDSSVKVVFKF